MAESRSQRLLDLLNVLVGAERPVPRARIKELVPGYPDDEESFRRQLDRDKRALADMGLTVETVPNPGGADLPPGYRIPAQGAFMRNPGLEPDELAALNLAVEAVRLEGLEPGAGLASLGGRPVGVTGARPTRPLAGVEADDRVTAAFAAVTGRRVLRFAYGGEQRQVEPHRVAFTRGRWYLVGHDRGRGAARTFRLDRVEGGMEAGEAGAFPPPAPGATHSPRLAAWQFGDGPAEVARLAVDPGHEEEVALVVGSGGAGRTTAPDGRTVFEVTVTNPEALRNLVLGFGEHVELLGPDALRQELVAWLSDLAGAS